MRFVILGDLHYSDYREPDQIEARERLFKTWLSQVAALQPDVVFAIGDTTNRGTLSEMQGLQAIIQESGLNFVRVTGNHDCYSLSKPELAPFFLGGRTPVSADEIYTSFDTALVRFVVLDTARDRDRERYDGFVSDAQLAWLGQEIEKFNRESGPRYLMALGHHPIFGTTRRSSEEMLQIQNSEAVNEKFALLQRGPGFYICGHNHSHSLFGPDAIGWYHVQTADPLDCRSFRLITVTEERVEVEVVDFDMSDPTLAADFETARSTIEAGFHPQEFDWVYGKPEEHRLLVNI